PNAQHLAASRSPARDANKPGHWPYLEGTLQEVECIAGLWKRPERVKRLLGKEAQEATLRARLPQARYVHLATHGFFADPTVPSAFRHDMTRDPLTSGGIAMTGSRATVTGRNPLLLSGVILAGANVPPPTDPRGTPLGDDGILTAEEV